MSARVLKECSSEIAPILALIYNETLAQGTVPDDWRLANVAPIFKKGEKYDAANYRPVSLTGWRSGAVVRVSDFGPRGPWFEPWPVHISLWP